MFYQAFLSPQVKRCAIITDNHGIYQFQYELLNGLRLRILGSAFSPLGGQDALTRKKKRLRILECSHTHKKGLRILGSLYATGSPHATVYTQYPHDPRAHTRKKRPRKLGNTTKVSKSHLMITQCPVALPK